jgi:poly(3-hydroxybutyrate) depolymerase
MRRFLLILLAVCSIPFGVAAAPDKDKIAKETLEVEGKKRTYYLYVPQGAASATPAAPVPLVLLLHGSNRNGLSLVEKWKELAAKENFIVAGPDSADSRGWMMPQDGPDFLHTLVESLKAKYPVNPRRVYLFGHSAGAGFALYMSLYESEYFAATSIHAGALAPESYGAIEYAKRKTPILIIVGTNDPFFPLKDVRATRDELNKRGFSVQLIEVPKHDHWYYDRAAEFNRSAWDFLKSQQLAEEPSYKQYNFKK